MEVDEYGMILGFEDVEMAPSIFNADHYQIEYLRLGRGLVDRWIE